jgi:hypothetical protein
VFLRTDSRTIRAYSLGLYILEGAIGQARCRIRVAPAHEGRAAGAIGEDGSPALDQLSSGSRRHNADEVNGILGTKFFHDP